MESTIFCEIKMEGIDKMPFYTKGEFDFKKIIPMPEEMDMDDGPYVLVAIATYLTEKGTVSPDDMSDENKNIADQFFIPPMAFITGQTYKDSENGWEALRVNMFCIPSDDLNRSWLYEQGRQYVRNYKKYGCATRTLWCLMNWGAGSNAFNTKTSADKITFNILQSPPFKILRRISELYPDKTMECSLWESGSPQLKSELTVRAGCPVKGELNCWKNIGETEVKTDEN